MTSITRRHRILWLKINLLVFLNNNFRNKTFLSTQIRTLMKKVLVILFAALYSTTTWCQVSWLHFSDEFYFVKEVPVAAFKGQNFRYEIAVKADASDTTSKVTILGVASGKTKDDVVNSNFNIETRKEQDWTIYTVIGKVPAGSSSLWFYATVGGKGRFYFDDVSFYIEKFAGQWKQLALFNHSFEETSPDIFAGYYVNKRKSENLKTRLANDIYKTGKRSLLVEVANTETAKKFASVN